MMIQYNITLLLVISEGEDYVNAFKIILSNIDIKYLNVHLSSFSYFIYLH